MDPRRIRFDAADRLPSSHWDRVRFPQMDPNEWAKAPEFVPRDHRSLDCSDFVAADCSPVAATFVSETLPFGPLPYLADPAIPPFVPAVLSGVVPPGYSANVAAIDAGNGAPPIAAIILRKRRRRHHRASRRRLSPVVVAALADASPPVDPRPTPPSRQFERSQQRRLHRSLSVCSVDSPLMEQLESAAIATSRGELNGNAQTGSCPDLSEEQRSTWDDILYKAVQNERDALDHKTEFMQKSRRKTEPNSDPMQTSIYEICAPVEMEQSEDDDADIRDFNGNRANELAEELQSPASGSSSKENDSDSATPPAGPTQTQKLAQKLRKELEDLQFRNTYEWQRSDGKVASLRTNPLFEMGAAYPQPDFEPTHLSNYDPKQRSFATSAFLQKDDEELEKCSFEADYFEGMNIRVNPFEDSIDIALSEADCPPPTRFQQLQWAIQRQKERYNDQLQMPQRVCCSIM